MKDHQPKLTPNTDSRNKSNGPVFEFGPGWGSKTRKFLKKYAMGGDCSLCRNTRYILLAGIIVIIIGLPYFKKLANQQQPESLVGQIKITEVVQPSDSKIKLARRALSAYLAQFPDPSITNGQRVFMETVLGQDISNDAFKAGTSIDFSADTLKSVIAKSKSLSPTQIKYWEQAARGIKF